MIMKAREAAKIMNGTFTDIPNAIVFTGVSTDTRSINDGDMFVAIKGENFDGAEYIEKAFEKGASCILTSIKSPDSRIITVDDPVIALGLLAKYKRNTHKVPVIAVTGSVGKTTVKNMLISVFSQKYTVHSTSGNKNNHIGLPMTLLKLENSHEISIIEMGMSDLGEIDYLSSITQPDYAVITNIGMSHIGILGSRDNILKAKSEVMNHMKPGGTVLVNGDDDMLSTLDVKTGLTLEKFGTDTANDYIADEISSDVSGNCIFTSEGTLFTLPVPGAHNAVNAMAAVALGRIFTIDENLIQKGLLEFSQSKMRMYRYTQSGVDYINDAYNANPQSMRAALDILNDSQGRKIAVLGDMLEMGDFSKAEHVKLGAYAANTADILILCGDEANNIAAGAAESDKKIDIHTFKNSDDAGAILKELINEGDTVLVKGSRGMKMENVLEYTKDGGQE